VRLEIEEVRANGWPADPERREVGQWLLINWALWEREGADAPFDLGIRDYDIYLNTSAPATVTIARSRIPETSTNGRSDT
jgi:hypothetical protein